MKEHTKQILKKIGFIASYLPFAAISVFFLIILDGGNRTFLAYSTPDSGISTQLLGQIVTIFSYAVIAIILVITVVSFIMRQNKTVNKVLLWVCGILSLLYMLFFMIMCKLIGLFEIAWANTNLYVLYFMLTAFSTAIVLYSAIRNLVKIKKAPVTFAKNNTQKALAKGAEESTEAEAETEPEAEEAEEITAAE